MKRSFNDRIPYTRYLHLYRDVFHTDKKPLVWLLIYISRYIYLVAGIHFNLKLYSVLYLIGTLIIMMINGKKANSI